MALDQTLSPPALERATAYSNGPKRVFDVVGALLLGAICAPVVLCLASPSWARGAPAFFGHRRLGRDGRLFTCWKLRTMRCDAEEVLRAHLAADPAAAREWAATFKLRDDPRVTPLGRVLRRLSLDELPQLWNVLRGEMSLVGPRPITPGERDKFAAMPWVLESLRPGMTGMWQVAHRRGAPYSERLACDRAYLARIGFRQDVRILLQTFAVLFRRSGY